MPTDSVTCGAISVRGADGDVLLPEDVARREGRSARPRRRRRSGDPSRSCGPIAAGPAHPRPQPVGDGGGHVTGPAAASSPRTDGHADADATGPHGGAASVPAVDGRQLISSGSPFELDRRLQPGRARSATGSSWPAPPPSGPTAPSTPTRPHRPAAASRSSATRWPRRAPSFADVVRTRVVPGRRRRLRRRSPRCTARSSATSGRPTPPSWWPRCSTPQWKVEIEVEADHRPAPDGRLARGRARSTCSRRSLARR